MKRTDPHLNLMKRINPKRSGINMKIISVQDFFREDHKKYVLLDVRTPEEYAGGHIEGAKNMDAMNHTVFQEDLKKLPQEDVYLVYCRTNNRSKYALEMMEREGFKNVTLLDGGYTAWETEQL